MVQGISSTSSCVGRNSGVSENVAARVSGILFNILAAIAVAVYFVTRPFYSFSDRGNYLIHAQPGRFGNVLDRGPVEIIEYQPLWRAWNEVLTTFFDEKTVVLIHSGLSTFLLIFAALSLIDRFGLRFQHKLIFLVLFFTLPMFHDKTTSHLRQGLAISLFVTSFLLRKPSQVALVWLLPFIHYGFLITATTWTAVELLRTERFRPISCLTPMVLVSLLTMFMVTGFMLLYLIALLVDFDRLSYYLWYREVEVTGLGLVLWGFVAFLLIAQGKEFLRNNLFVVTSVLQYLIGYVLFLTPARMFNNAQVLVAIAGLQLTGYRLIGFYFVLALLVGRELL